MVKDIDSEAEIARSRPSRSAMAAIPVASERELPAESRGIDPCQTPLAHAVVPPSLSSEREPTSVDLLLDDRVERLLRENYLLLKERKELREIAQIRAEACNERLFQMREAKRLVRAFVAAQDKLDYDFASEEYAALAAWADKPI